MSDYDNSNSGVLFPNEKKTKANQPSLRGQMDIGGTEYWASAWRKVSSETGLPYLSIAMQEKNVEDAPNINAELHPIAERKSEKAPSFEGVIRLSDEEELPIVAWVKTRAANGTSFFAIRVDTSEQSSGGGDKIDEGDMFFGMGEQKPNPIPADDDWDDDIPF